MSINPNLSLNVHNPSQGMLPEGLKNVKLRKKSAIQKKAQQYDVNQEAQETGSQSNFKKRLKRLNEIKI